MSKLLMNGLLYAKNSVNALHNTYNEWTFGLKLMSQKRKQYYYRVILLSTTGLTTGLYFTYNTLFINQYKAVVHSYKSGRLSQLDKDLELFAANVWTECQQSVDKSPESLQFFPSVGCDPLTIGTLGLPSGAVIGLPFPLTYRTVDDVKTVDLRFKGEHNPYMKWRSAAGKAFIESLVLSERAKKFAIARPIHMANNVNLFLDCLNISVATIVAIGLAQEIIARVKALQTFGQRFVVRSLSLIVAYYLWSTLNQSINYYATLRADKRAISVGEDYYVGAIEYYTKMKTRNAAFNELTEDNGWKVFTEEGEIKGLISSRLLTISRRINYLKSLKSQQNNELNVKLESK